MKNKWGRVIKYDKYNWGDSKETTDNRKIIRIWFEGGKGMRWARLRAKWIYKLLHC